MSRLGKAAAARNSRWHGLAVPVLQDPAWSPEVTALARKIAGAKQASLFEAACRIAEAQVDLRRLRLYRAPVMEGAQLVVSARTAPPAPEANQTPPSVHSAPSPPPLTPPPPTV